MRLSTAILLGAISMDKLLPGSGGHCALNAGLKAVGSTNTHWSDAAEIWPWLVDRKGYPLPCRHTEATGLWAVAHLFDRHVMGRCHAEHGMTLEQLCDWVRSVEPEEAPEQAEVFAETEKIAAGDTRRQG
jgi:hypothetical protein